MTNLTTNLREFHQPPNPMHIEIEHQEVVIKKRGDQILAATIIPLPLLAHMDAEIIGSLNLTTGNLDYQETFSPTSFFSALAFP